MSNNFTIKQVIDIVDKNIEMENKFDCSKVDLMHTIIVQNEKIDKAIEWVNNIQQDKDHKHLEPYIATDTLDELLEILGGKNEIIYRKYRRGKR